MRPLDSLDRRRNGTRAMPRSGYAALSRKIDALRASEVGWAADLCEQLGLNLDITIGELLCHADKHNRGRGGTGFLREDLLRREGRSPAEIAVSLDLAGQYRMLGRRIREALARRGLDDAVVQAVAEAIAEAVRAVEEGEAEDDL